MVPAERGIFHKGPLGDEARKSGRGDKEVTFAFYFTGPRLARCVGNGKSECVRMFIKKFLN